MRKVIACAAMAAGLMMAGQAAAEPYRLVALNDDVAVFLNDGRTKSSIYKVVWLTAIYKSPDEFQGKRFTYSVEQWEVDCSGDRLRSRARAFYIDAGELVGSSDRIGEWGAAYPNSLGDAISQATCKPSKDEPYDLDIGALIDIARKTLWTD
jgi:hypothetical protein